MNIQEIKTLEQATEWGLEDEMVLHRDRLKNLREEQARLEDERTQEGNIFGGLE